MFLFNRKKSKESCKTTNSQSINHLFYTFITSLEPKVQVTFSNHNEFVSRHRWCCLCSKLFTLSSSSSESISTKLGTKHPWVKGIQVCLNKGSIHFPRGENNKIREIHRRNFNMFFSRTIGPTSCN